MSLYTVSTYEVVDDDRNSQVRSSHKALSQVGCSAKVLGLLHLADDVKVVRGDREGENGSVERVHTSDKARVTGSGGICRPGSLLRCLGRTVLHTDGDTDGDDGRHDTDETGPSDPRDLVERLDGGEDETEYETDNDKDDC
jgi:hypothetical protein